jgi:hypothetical protein
MIRSLRGLLICMVALVVIQLAVVEDARAQVVNSSWNTGNGNWNVPGNWTPNTAAPNNGAPLVTNTYNVQIGNLPVANAAQVTFVPVSGTSGTISTLTVSVNADLLTNGNQLNVLGTTVIDGAGTSIHVDPHTTPGTAAFTSLSVNLNNGGGLTMTGGIATVSGQLAINSGVLGGHGTVNVGDFDGAIETALNNSALVQPQGNTAAAQTLTIHANGVDTIDLDGTGDAGSVDVDNAVANANADTVTLVIDGPLTDAFGGAGTPQLQIGQRDTLTFTRDFTIAGPATIAMAGGNDKATLNGAGKITSITGATFTVSGAALIANDMTFTGTANTVTVNANSSLELGGTVTMADASAMNLSQGTSELIISGNTTVTEAAGDFNWDGPGIATTTVKGTGQLNLTVNRVDTTDDLYGGTLNLVDNGDVTVDNAANVWTMAGTVHKSGTGTSTIGGDAVNVMGIVTVDAGGQLSTGTMTLSPGANDTVNGTMVPGSASVFAGPTSVTGTGTLRMAGTSTVSANTTIGVSTFDWDGLTAGSLQTINTGVVFTINSTTFDSDGDMDDPISLGGSGAQLVVNGVTDWTMAAALTTNAVDIGTATIGGTARMTLSTAGGTWSVTGNTNTTGPVTFGASSVTTIAAARTLRLDSGGFGSDASAIAGGTINGPGTLAANTGRALRGFGTVGAPVDFDGTAAIFAENGTLTLNGAIVDVGTIGTSTNTGILNIPAAWNSNVADFVNMNGGTLQGGTITVANTNGISGFGTVTSRVVNNSRLSTSNVGQTLIFQTAANDNDWDGASNTGVLDAIGGTLELRDNATFAMAGTVSASSGGRVFSNGFGFNFSTGSTIQLQHGTYESTSSTDISGAVNVLAGGGDSTIKVTNNFFLTFDPTAVTTLGANLRLDNNNINIKAGATFSGAGAIIIPKGSHLVADNLANIGVLLDNEGAFRPGNFDGIGRVNLLDYQQQDSGELYVEIVGTLLNQYDRLVVNGVAQIDGYLNVDIDEVSPGVPFVPALGQTFNIISAPGGVIGTFDTVDISGFPAGLTVHVNYMPTFVQLQVVTKPIFQADFDDDGDVDMTDYQIWRHAFQLNQLGDANGDNQSNAADYVIWRKEFGSHPGAGSAADGLSGANVPEPATLALLTLLACAGIFWRPRSRSFKHFASAAGLPLEPVAYKFQMSLGSKQGAGSANVVGA